MKNELDAINIYYKNHLAEIGGIETATYNIAKKYSHKKDILFLIGDGHPSQIKRLSKIAKVEKYNPNKQYYCKKVFITYETEVPKNIHSDHRARVSHGDLIEIQSHGWNLPKDETITEDYGVSTNTCETVKKVMGKNARLCPNPIFKVNTRKLLKLISPQRMTWEKGAGRIKEIARQLELYDIPYQWIVFCNDENEVKALDNNNIVWMKSRLDISSFVEDADYLVLVSECEGSPMSPQEALMLGTPIIVTDLPCYKDFNINEKHGFFLNKDLSNLDVQEIYYKKDTFNFNWTPPKDIWGEILLDGKCEKEYEKMKTFKVKATKEAEMSNIVINELGRVAKDGDTFDILEDRVDVLTGNNSYNIKFVDVIKENEEVKEEAPKKKKGATLESKKK